MRKLLIILVVCFSLFPLSVGNTEEGLYINAYDWQNWSEGQKISFVIGWLKCGKKALDNLPYFVTSEKKWDESKIFIEITHENFQDAGMVIGGITVGQVIDTIGQIYSDPRVKTMDITEIMPLVNGRLCQGWTNKELDEVIAINVKLKQCENKEKKMRQFIEECAPLRKEKGSLLQRLKKK